MIMTYSRVNWSSAEALIIPIPFLGCHSTSTTDIEYLRSSKLGDKYKNDIFVSKSTAFDIRRCDLTESVCRKSDLCGDKYVSLNWSTTSHAGQGTRQVNCQLSIDFAYCSCFFLCILEKYS